MAGTVLSSLTAYRTVTYGVEVLGSPLGVDLGGRWILTLLLVVLTASGMDGMVRYELAPERVQLRYAATFWILPGLIALAAGIAVPRLIGDTAGWLSSLILLGGLLALVMVAEIQTLDTEGPHYRTARLLLNLATYGAAFALYATIYGLQLRSLLSMPAVAVITFPLALELLRGTREQLETTWLYAAVVALVLAQLTWALNPLGFSTLAGGGLLLLAFYSFSGIAQQYLAGRLNSRVIWEYVTVATLGTIVIIAAAPWMRLGG